MAIWAYTGLPRHGKSYHAVKDQVVPALRAGRRVVTNVPLVEKNLRVLCGDGGEIRQVTNEELASDPDAVLARECLPGSLCLFDELWRFLPAGLQAKNAPAGWKTLFAEHGHEVDVSGNMTQIVLVTQDLSQVSAFARQLVERTVIVRKMTVIGSSKRYRVDVYAGGVTGTNPPVGRRISEGFGTFEKTIQECYVSRTKSQADGGEVNESVLDGRGTIWRHPFVRYGLPLAVVLGVWGVSRVVGFFGGDVGTGEASGASKVVAPVKRFAQVGAVPSGNGAAVVARISGVLRGESDSESKVLLEDAGFYRWVSWHTARCRERYDDVLVCDYEGKTYAFDVDVLVRRPKASGGGLGEALGFPADGGGSR